MSLSLPSIRGTHDLLGQQFRIHQWLIDQAKSFSECYGYEGIATPIFEFTEVFRRTLGESSEVVNKQMYTFADNNGESLTLRPEGTAGIARAFITHQLNRELPLKFYYHGPMFRYERPQKGRQRQFHQFGVELLGISDYRGDVEVIALAHSFLKSLQILPSIRLEINSIGDSSSRQNYKNKLSRYLEKYETDLSDESQKRLRLNPLRILDSKSPQDQKILVEAPVFSDCMNQESSQFFDHVLEQLSLLGVSFQINSRLVRGLDYYSHCVFEFKSHELGTQDAVLSGGRYDGLIELMGGSPTPGVGWATGLERLALLVKSLPLASPPVVLIPLGENAEKKMSILAYQFRERSIPTAMDFNGNLKKRLARSCKLKAEWALILGEEELKKNVITIKNLLQQTQEEITLDTELILARLKK